ncbi:uncharacterized protein Dmoj_GI11761 [Drosophila mojavensis]|uniref:Dendritic cell-specific transmembrane protein-like domain-containing protein n=2 Tax=Drosophila mojavensis TaxID=7230 RepID=B4KZR3_DROMO|nr:uncharacterized protein Dmoj_GI11761 [Drosophila mojavensis]
MRLTRHLCSFVVGIVLGYLLWILFAMNANLGLILKRLMPERMVVWVVILWSGLSYMLSRNVRVITLLMFVSLLGKAGQSYLRAVAFAFVIAGPIDNLVQNAQEVARVFSCTTLLTYNLTKTRFDLMAKPFTNTLQTMREDLDEIQVNFRELQTILDDLKYGVENTNIEDDKFGHKQERRAAKNVSEPTFNNSSKQVPKASAVQAKFLRNMRNRCKHQLRSGHRVCQEIFLQGYRKCTTNFPDWLVGVLCWPYRVDVICKINMFGNPDKVCDASKVVPPKFGETYVKLLVAEHELYDNNSNIEITYQLQNITTSEQFLSAKETSEQFMKDFEHKKRIFQTVMRVVEKFMYLFVLIVIYSSIRYQYLYCTDLEFDNIYITDYFRHVDERRKRERKRSVLPLRSHEKPMFVEGLGRSEGKAIHIFNFLHLSLEMVTAGVFLVLDHLVVSLLQTIHQRSLIIYRQEGEHEVRFRINGTGLMARLLRTTMRNFNIHERVSTSLSNEECLPVAHVLPRSFYIELLLIYLLIILLIYESAKLLGLRRTICGYFYYKHEKRRILYLFTTFLRSRLYNRDLLLKRAEENLASRHLQGKRNIFLLLRLKSPKYFGWLARYDCGKRRCLICNAVENDEFVICDQCTLPYCRPCCRELKFICIYCGNLMTARDDYDSSATRDANLSNRKEK